jgi:hypothetical protein
MNRSSHNKTRNQIPFDFVLDELETLSPITRPMFGCTAVYVGEKIVLILRNKNDGSESDGVWLATTVEHHQSLRAIFPTMRSIGVLGKGVTGWQLLQVNNIDFEESVTKACELILNGDPRIGKIPKRKTIKPSNKSKSSKERESVGVSRSRKR